MQLQGKKIVLRSVLPSDADLLYKWENDKTNWQVSGTKKPFTKKEIKEFISRQKDIYLDKQLRWMIASNENSVGCVDLFKFDEKNLKAGIGILIDKNHRRKGYASEALSLLIVYCFEILNLRKLFCNISSDNKASVKLFQKHKFIIKEKKASEYVLQLASP